MKVKLKQGASTKDIPRNSGIHKRVVCAFENGEKELELDFMPKGLDEYVEAVNSEQKKSKGDK